MTAFAWARVANSRCHVVFLSWHCSSLVFSNGERLALLSLLVEWSHQWASVCWVGSSYKALYTRSAGLISQELRSEAQVDGWNIRPRSPVGNQTARFTPSLLLLVYQPCQGNSNAEMYLASQICSSSSETIRFHRRRHRDLFLQFTSNTYSFASVTHSCSAALPLYDHMRQCPKRLQTYKLRLD